MLKIARNIEIRGLGCLILENAKETAKDIARRITVNMNVINFLFLT